MFLRLFCIYSVIVVVCACSSADKRNTEQVKRITEQIDGEPVVPRTANKIWIFIKSAASISPDVTKKLHINLRERISIDGRLAVVDTEKEADLSMRCIVTHYELQVIKYDDFSKPLRKRLRVRVSLAVRDNKKAQAILFERGLQAFHVYSDTEHPVVTDIQARFFVLNTLADRITSKVITGWYTDKLTDIEKRKKK